MSRQINLGQVVPNIQIGTTITKAPGTSAEVENVGTELNPILNFYIPKGEPGVINLLIVNELPQVGRNDTLYFVPKQDTETSDLYDEYIWLDNQWEIVGERQIEVDLTDYVKNTDYATSSKGGVVKVTTNNATSVGATGNLIAEVKTYEQYQSAHNYMFIGKGTLENVIEGKDLTTKAYVDGLVGNISSVIDAINGEVV